jgi:hypothetical protein
VSAYEAGVRFWSRHAVACWTALALLAAIYAAYVLLVVPWQHRRAAAADEHERRKLAQAARADATRLAAVDELQRKLAAEAVDVEEERRAHEREKRLKKLALPPTGLAGHRLGTAADHVVQRSADTPPPKQKKAPPKKAAAESSRPAFSHFGPQGGPSYKPSGSMRRAGGG